MNELNLRVALPASIGAGPHVPPVIHAQSTSSLENWQ